MDMATVMNMIETRRGKTSFEDYAHTMGLKLSVLYKYVRESRDRDMSVPNYRKMVQFYQKQGDIEMVNALIAYATGIDDLTHLIDPDYSRQMQIAENIMVENKDALSRLAQ